MSIRTYRRSTLAAVQALARQYARLDQRAEALARHDYQQVYPSLRRRLTAAFGNGLQRLRLLDFGCGYTYPLVVLFHGQLAEIVGLEVAPVFRDGWAAHLRAQGGRPKPSALLTSWLEHRQAALYLRHLANLSGKSIRHDEYHLSQYDGQQLPQSLGEFDAVISNAVLQELPGALSSYARELAGVLRPGGFIDLEWHNFYSWSGHYLGEAESRAHPWGHLLEGRFHPSLNRVTPDQVAEAFAPWFVDLRLLGHDADHRHLGDPEYQLEGTEYLTPELASRLAKYPREWLLTRGYVLQGHRR